MVGRTALVRRRKLLKVTKEQAEHFRAAVAYYQCAVDEVALMRAAYQGDSEGAAVCFAALAAQIERMAVASIQDERVLTGEQFLKLGVLAKQMEAMRDAD
jgi:hypothetical protein